MTSTSSNYRSKAERISSFREDFVQAESFKSSDRNEVIGGKYRIAFFAVSWDRRCLSLSLATSWTAERAVIILPPIRDQFGVFKEHQRQLQETLAARKIPSEVIDGADPKIGFEGIWDRLYAIALDEGKRSWDGLPFLLDLSAMSRYYSAGLLAMVVRLGLASRLDCFYAEGKYDATQDVRDVLFSGGEWERKSVPFLDGCGNPSLGWYYVVAAGFDGEWIKKILLQDEPDRVGMLIPIPGVDPKYEDHCLQKVEPIVRDFMVPDNFQTRAHAADAVDAWRKLSVLNHERWDNEQVAYLACGTKPHALAMALRALVHRFPVVLYFKPERYNVTIVEEAGVFWLYSVTDLSSLGALNKESG